MLEESKSEYIKIIQQIIERLEFEKTKEDCMDCLEQILDSFRTGRHDFHPLNEIKDPRQGVLIDEVQLASTDSIEGVRLIMGNGTEPTRLFTPFSVNRNDTLTIKWNFNFI